MTENSIKKAVEYLEIKPLRILVVDDEEFNLDILKKHLKKAGHKTICISGGKEAWEYLKKTPEDIDIVLLDKMMPYMNGIEVLKKIKLHPILKKIPVIMQTAAATQKEEEEGIQAGAYYYVTKPYNAETLISMVNTAARDFQYRSDLIKSLPKSNATIEKRNKTFEAKTIKDARILAAKIASITPEPIKSVIGISGLIINAIEHGNLKIGYSKKKKLLNKGTLEKEIETLQNLAKNKDKKIKVVMEKTEHYIKIVIKDQGEGFDWKEYIDFKPNRMTNPNGRGIAIANILASGGVKYNESGNEVTYIINL